MIFVEEVDKTIILKVFANLMFQNPKGYKWAPLPPGLLSPIPR